MNVEAVKQVSMNTEGCTNRDVVIRRGSPDDIDAIVKICQMGFPKRIRWQGLRSLARRWWQVTMLSSEAETWILQNNNEIIGVCVLVTNETKWAQEERQRRGPYVLRFISAISCPILAVSKIVRTMTDKIRTDQTQAPASIDWMPGIRTWVEIIVVCPQHRGRGFAKRLLLHCETRTRALGGGAIALRVRRDNKPARQLYETMGYKEVNVTPVESSYAKVVV